MEISINNIKSFFLKRKLRKVESCLIKAQQKAQKIEKQFEVRPKVFKMYPNNQSFKELEIRKREFEEARYSYRKSKFWATYWALSVSSIIGFFTVCMMFKDPKSVDYKVPLVTAASASATLGGALVFNKFVDYRQKKNSYEGMKKYLEGKHKTLNSQKQKIQELTIKQGHLKQKIEEINNCNEQCLSNV